MGSNVVSYILLGFILVAMIAFMVVQGRRQKKAQDDYLAMLDTLRPGVKVKMASGLLGRIKEVREEAPGFKTVTLNVGDDKNEVAMTFVIEAVQGIVNEEAINKLNTEKAIAEMQTEVKTVETAEVNADAKNEVKTTKSASKKTASKRK